MTRPRGSVPLVGLFALLASLSGAAQTDPPAAGSAAETKEDLGDTGAPPPSAEDLGKVPAVDSAPEPPKKRRKKEAAPDAGPADAAGPPKTAQPPAAAAATPATPIPAAPSPAALAQAAKAATQAAEQAAKADKLAADLNAALLAEPGDTRQLESLPQTAGIEALIALQPTIRPLARLAKARAFLLQGRLDEAQTALGDARAAADGTSGPKGKKVAAQVRFRLGELEEARLLQRRTCGLELGLSRLAAFEGKRAQEASKKIAARYKSAAQSGDRFWARRAAFRTAVLYEQHYREAIKPAKSLRAVRLPSPFSLGKVSTDLLLADVVKGPWPSEIARLYSSVIGSVDARDPDPQLVERARKAAAELGRLAPSPGETAENPFLADERPGLIRFSRRFEQRDAQGQWRSMEAAVARKALASIVDGATAQIAPSTDGTAAAAGKLDVAAAYALVALAEASPPPPVALIAAVLASKDPRTRLAGLLAAERAPDAAFAEALVTGYLATAAESKKGAFGTLQGALYGEAERTLLALRAVAAKDRATAEKLVADSRLPPAERAWIVAEVGDARLAAGLQSLAWQEELVAARAIFGIYLAQGRNGLGYARPNAEGLVGCVSKAVHEMDSHGAR